MAWVRRPGADPSGRRTAPRPGPRRSPSASGAGRYLIGANQLTLRHGDLVLVSPGTPHDYGTVGTYWESWWAHFQPRRQWHSWLSLPQAMPGLSYVRLTRSSETDRVVSAFDPAAPRRATGRTVPDRRHRAAPARAARRDRADDERHRGGAADCGRQPAP